MRKLTAFMALLSMSVLNVISQDASRFFKKDDLLKIGVYYYPEHWDPSQWDRDFRKIAEMGFEFTHFAEFAWAMIEPEEGKFDFSWLDKAVALADKHGLEVIICTSTATPPVWLATKHPEIYLWDENYIRRLPGARGDYSFSSDVYWNYTEKCVAELARRYGHDKRIWGWQIDNEPSAPADHSPAAEEKFRSWLKKKYKTVQELNKKWGTAFWGAVVNDFSQVRIPNTRHMGGVSPHAVLDFKRFTADQQAAFLNFQADIIRKYVSEEQWITTNYISTVSSMDARRADKLDFASFTVYPVRGVKDASELGFRIGSRFIIPYGCAFHKNINGITGIMELQPGQVNWAAINPQPLPGVVRMWLWNAFAGGCSFACTYRFRQPLYGSELYHAGIVGTDGVTPSQGGREYQQFISEIKSLRKIYDPRTAVPKRCAERKTAILWNHENVWDIDYQRQTSQWNTWTHMFKYLEAVKRCGAPLEIIPESADFNQYRVLIAPACQLVDSDLIDRWTEYVKNGGHLVLTCRTGQKDRSGQLWPARWASPILPLIGGEILYFDLMLPDGKGIVQMENQEYEWNNWGEVIEPREGTRELAVYGNQFYSGKAAVISRGFGKGTVTYIGVDTDDGRLEHKVMRKVYQGAGVPIEDYPEGVFVDWRDGFWVAVNYSSTSCDFPLSGKAKIIIGDKKLNPAGVLVWIE